MDHPFPLHGKKGAENRELVLSFVRHASPEKIEETIRRKQLYSVGGLAMKYLYVRFKKAHPKSAYDFTGTLLLRIEGSKIGRKQPYFRVGRVMLKHDGERTTKSEVYHLAHKLTDGFGKRFK